MFKLYVLPVLFFFICFYGHSQQLPVDFTDNADEFIAFSGSGFSFNSDPQDSNNTVGLFYNDGTQNWQGFYLDIPQNINLSEAQVISLSFYAFDLDSHTIMVKLENGTDANVEVVQSVSGSGWTSDITFNFANAFVSGTSTITNALGTYSRLVIFIDGGVALPGTYLIDDIDNGLEPTDPNAIDVVYSDLVWNDEFDADGPVDANNWFHQTQLPFGGSWANGEQQHYTNRIENSFVDNGFLNIVAKNETFTDQGETKFYTSARLNSKFAFTYGRVDVRAKLPFGDGTWPAIWTLGKNINENGAYWNNEGYGTTNWPLCGEIDIMEHGLGAINHVSSALHSACNGCSGATVNYQSFALNDVANEFHVYSVNWSPDQITFLIDGVGFYTYNPAVKDVLTWPFYEDQYILLNVAMGGIAGPIDPNFDQSSMIIDYVRVYQNEALSLDEFSKESVSLYPNPVSDVLHIQTSQKIDAIDIYNPLGKLILKATKVENQLDLSALETGIYLIKLYSGDSAIMKKIIVK